MTDQISGPNDQRTNVSTERDRKAYVRDWIARRLKSGGLAGGGLVGTLLTLPMIAAAQAVDQFVSAARIDGVTNVRTMSDGTAQLVMNNGTTISVPASDVQVAANGDVLVSARVEEIAAEVMAAGGAGAGASTGAIIAAGAGAGAIAAAAGGGGGDGGDGGTLPVINSATLAASGGVGSENTGIALPEGTTSVEVTVTDADGNETTGDGQVGAEGAWTLDLAPEEIPQGRVTVTVASRDAEGEEIDTTSQDVIIDTKPPEITITNTGLGEDGVLNLAEQDAGITVTGTTDAEDGQPVTVTLDGAEFTGTVNDGAWSVDIPASGLAGLDPSATDVAVTAAVEDAAGNAGDTSETILLDLAAPTISLDDVSGDNQIGLLDTQGDLEITGSTDAETGQEVTVTFGGQAFTGTVGSGGGSGAEPNAWTVTVPQSAVEAVEADAIDGQASVAVAATVTDAAGNPAETPATRTVSADFRGPSITIDAIADDNVINIAENNDSGGITISGSTNNVPAGQDVTVSVGGTALNPVPTDANGDWQVTVPQGDPSLPADGASVTVTADVSDGETDAPQASVFLAADFTAPTLDIDEISGGIINIAESTEPLTISGTTNAEGNQTVTLAVPGVTDPVTAPVDAGGTWTVTLTATQTDAFAAGQDGQTPQITADVSDAAGNSTTATRTVAVDRTAPEVTVDAPPLGGDGILNIAEAGSPVQLSGTVSGQSDFTVTLNGSTLTDVVVTGTDWTVDVPPAILQALPSGQTIDITAEATDAAGNTAAASESFDTDLDAPTIAITDTGVGSDDTLNIAERDAGITVEGTATGADGQQVTVTLSGQAQATPITATGTVSGGTFAAAFAPGDLAGIGGWSAATVTAEVADAAGNPATPATDSFDIDVTAPTIAFDDLPQGVTLTFTRADGTVDLSLTEAIEDIPETGGVFEFPVTPAQFAAVQDETDYTVELSIIDQAGNSNAGSETISVSTNFEPTLTIDEIGEDGAVDISDTAGASISGTTLGVEQGQQITVTATGATGGAILIGTAAAAADGTWGLTVPPAAFDNLTPGETFTVDATVTNAAGRDATGQQAGIDAYLPAVYAVANTAEAGSTLSMTAFAAEGFDAVQGIEAIMSFNPSLASYVTGSDTNEFDGLFISNDTNAAAGTVSFNGGNLTAQVPEGEVIFGFEMEDQGAGPITLSFTDDAQGGPTELRIGTSGADTLTAANSDSVIQGKGGADQIDVSATGTNIVLFELDQTANGTDTVTGFTTGTTFQADQIAFLGEADLRGAGDTVESLATGGTLGANTGFVIFTTALGDTGAPTIEAALEGLTGETAGDVFYALAGDGTDAALVRATVNGADDITTEQLADFAGIGDLGNLSEDNVVLPDPASQPMA